MKHRTAITYRGARRAAAKKAAIDWRKQVRKPTSKGNVHVLLPPKLLPGAPIA